MVDFFDELIGSELSLMFFISLAVWILILIYIYYTNIKVKKLERELTSLRNE